MKLNKANVNFYSMRQKSFGIHEGMHGGTCTSLKLNIYYYVQNLGTGSLKTTSENYMGKYDLSNENIWVYIQFKQNFKKMFSILKV